MSTAAKWGVMAILAVGGVAACGDEPVSPFGQRGANGDPAYEELTVQAAVTGSPRDHDAMQAIVDEFDAAWTAGDGPRYAAQYAHIIDWVGPTGAVVKNPAALVPLYTGILTFGLPGTTRQSTIRNLTFLTGTIAVLDIDARVTGFTNPPPGITPWQPGTLRVLERNILQKRAGEWRIILHQQTSVAPGL